MPFCDIELLLATACIYTSIYTTSSSSTILLFLLICILATCTFNSMMYTICILYFALESLCDLQFSC